MLCLPMAINQIKKAWGQNFAYMNVPNISRKLQKIVLIVAFAATHALLYSLDIEIVTLLKRVRTPVALN